MHRYVLRRTVEVGGTAHVWEATDLHLGRSVAVKLLFDCVEGDPRSRERFAREAEALAALRHRHIVNIIDFDSDGSCLVMPFLPGGSMAARMKGVGTTQALAWLSAIAEALDYAHRKGIVHRDIKPANLLFDENDDLAVSDFGLARRADETRLTKMDVVIGTPGYMSPEQIRGAAEPASDQYSLGVLAFALLVGTLPFHGSDWINATLNADAPFPSQMNPKLPPAVDPVLAKALAKTPSDRFPSCCVFLAALREACGHPSAADDTRSVPLTAGTTAALPTTDAPGSARVALLSAESVYAPVAHPPPAPGALERLTPAPFPETGLIGEFIGRRVQLQEVQEALAAHRLVTLVGSGGMGKTRLALELLTRLGATPAPAPAMALSFLSLERVDESSEAAIMDAFASGMRLTAHAPEDPRAALVRHLGGGPVLLILDNCEAVRAALAPLLRYLLSQCPGLRCLATSQHQLGLQGVEAVYELPPLSVPNDTPGRVERLETLESYALFLSRARLSEASWTPEKGSEKSLRRILQLTDGIPLAVEIVAAWAPFLSLGQICDELLKTPLGRVTEVDDFGSLASDRHRSMLRCFEWSYGHLSSISPVDAVAFQRLGVFAGPFTEAAVESICDIPAARASLAHLAKTSFVLPCPGTDPRRYSMLGLMRTFSRAKALENGLDGVLCTRHMTYFQNLVATRAEDGVVERHALAAPEFDWPDLLAAADEAYRDGRCLAAVWEISRALSPFLWQRGFWTQRERLNWLAVVAARRAGAEAVFERALIDLGVILEAQGRWEEAAYQYKRALASAKRRRPPDVHHQSMALERLARVLVRMGDAPQAERAARALSAISPLLRSTSDRARGLDKSGQLLLNRGDVAGAEEKFRESLRIREESGDERGLARSRMNLGSALVARQEWAEAEEALRGSLLFWQEHGTEKELGIVLHLLADLFRRQARYAEAMEYCNQSLARRANDPKGLAVTLALQSRLLLASGQVGEAIGAAERSRDLGRTLGDAEGESLALDLLGSAYAAKEGWEQALSALAESLRLKESAARRDVVGLGITVDRIAQIHARRAQWAEARAAYSRSMRFSQEAGRPIQVGITMVNVAMMFAAQGEKDAAMKQLASAIDLLSGLESGKSVLFEARRIRARLGRAMTVGRPWAEWGRTSFRAEHLAMRVRCREERMAQDWARVADRYEELAGTFAEQGQQQESALALAELGGAYRHLGHWRRAEVAIRRAQAVFEKAGVTAGVALSWHKLGDLFADESRWDEAIEAYLRSITMRREEDDVEGEAISQDAVSDVLVKCGRLEEADQALGRSWELLADGGTARQKYQILVRRFSLRVGSGDDAGSREIAAEMVEATAGNALLVSLAKELQSMADAGDWASVKSYLAGAASPDRATRMSARPYQGPAKPEESRQRSERVE